jgi:hypothetical protein
MWRIRLIIFNDACIETIEARAGVRDLEIGIFSYQIK